MPESSDDKPPDTTKGRSDLIRERLAADGFGAVVLHTDFCRDFAAHRVFAPPHQTPDPTVMGWIADDLLTIPWIVRARVMPLGGWVSASSLLPARLRPPPRPSYRPGPGSAPPDLCTVACQEARVTFPADCTCVCGGEFHGGSGHPWRHVGHHLLVAARR